MKMMRVILCAVVAGGMMGVGGCTQFLADQMVLPPNQFSPFRGKGEVTRVERGSTDGVSVGEVGKRTKYVLPMGTPEVKLAIWVVEPKGGAAARGTVLLLHGFLSAHWQMEGAAKGLVEAGYRAVLVDLRGHGESTGDFITFGVKDAEDLGRVTTFLQGRGLCGEHVGVYGTSYGAASALLYAAADPRVTAVVAVAPFSSLREEAPYFGRHMLPLPGAFYSEADYKAVVDRMGVMGSFDPDASSPVTAIRNTKAHVRLFHGDSDMIVPEKASEEIAAAGKGHVEFTKIAGKGHLALCFDGLGELRGETKAWFDAWLGEGK